MYKVEFYIAADDSSPVDEFLDEIAEAHRGKVIRWLSYLEKEGPNLPRPYADVLGNKIRELRIAIARHNYRFLYFFHGKQIVVTNAFLKKTDRVPQSEIERAKRHMADWINRYGGG